MLFLVRKDIQNIEKLSNFAARNISSDVKENTKNTVISVLTPRQHSSGMIITGLQAPLQLHSHVSWQ